MIILQLTEQEAFALRNLLDLSVKAGGMQVAEFAVALDHKIRQAATTGKATNGSAIDERPAL